MKSDTKKYSGKLAYPIRPPQVPGVLSGGEKEYRVWPYRAAMEAVEKLNLLLDYYSIAQDDPGRWQQLAFRLAVDHVPGFMVAEPARKRGQPQKWHWFRQVVLLAAIKRAEAEGRDRAAAIRHIEKVWGETSLRRRAEEAAKDDKAVEFAERIAENATDELIGMMKSAR